MRSVPQYRACARFHRIQPNGPTIMAAPTRGRTVFSRPLCSSLLQRPPHPPAEYLLENPVRAQLMSREPDVPHLRGNVKHVASSSPVQPREKPLVHDSVQITRVSLKVRVDKHDIPRLPSAQASRFLTRCSHLLCPHIRAANKDTHTERKYTDSRARSAPALLRGTVRTLVS